jgi:hypothetical protein
MAGVIIDGIQYERCKCGLPDCKKYPRMEVLNRNDQHPQCAVIKQNPTARRFNGLWRGPMMRSK